MSKEYPALHTVHNPPTRHVLQLASVQTTHAPFEFEYLSSGHLQNPVDNGIVLAA